MAIKDAWRFDKSQWALKAGIASALVLATIAWYARELTPATQCPDQTLLVFGLVYVARLYFAMLVLWSRPPDWHEIPIVYVFFIPSIFYTMARGKIDACSAPVTAVAIVLYVVGSGFSTVGVPALRVQEAARQQRQAHDRRLVVPHDARELFRRHAPVHGLDARVERPRRVVDVVGGARDDGAVRVHAHPGARPASRVTGRRGDGVP